MISYIFSYIRIYLVRKNSNNALDLSTFIQSKLNSMEPLIWLTTCVSLSHAPIAVPNHYQIGNTSNEIARPEVRYCILHTYTHTLNKPMQKRIGEETFINTIHTHTQPHKHIYLKHVLNCNVKIQIP